MTFDGLALAGLQPICDAVAHERAQHLQQRPMVGALTFTQLALLCGGALIGGAIFGVAGFAFGVIASLFLHHGFAAADVVFIVVSGALLLKRIGISTA